MVAAWAQRSNGAGTTESASAGSATVTTTAMGSSVAAGSGLLVTIRGFNASLPTISNVRSNKDGTTNFSVGLALAADSGGDFIAIYWLPNTAGGAGLTCTVTCSGTVSNLYAIAIEATGVPTDATFFDLAGAQNNVGVSTAPNTGSQTAGANAQLAISLFSDSSGGNFAVTTNGTGWTRIGTILNGASDVQGAVEMKADSAMGGTSVSNNWTIGEAVNWRAGRATFNASSGAAQDTPELRGRPDGARGQSHMSQLLAI